MTIVDALLKVALLGSAWVLYLLIALSVLSFAAMFERALYFRKHGRGIEELRNKLSSALLEDDLPRAEKTLAASHSIVAKILSEALRWRAGGADAVEDAVQSELGRARAELERGLNLLGTLGNNAPFIGLFGTVIGVIQAFAQLGAHGNKAAAMGNVMSGIAEALVATGVGIFVAIPAVVAYNSVQKRIGEIEGSIQALSKLLAAFIKTKEKSALVSDAASTGLVERKLAAKIGAASEGNDDIVRSQAVPVTAGGN